MNILLGTLSALVYGASDFVGGYASRDQPAVRVTLVVYLSSAVAIVPALLIGTAYWSAAAVTAGLVGGVFGCIGTWLFYAALAAGPVGFVAPVVAAMCAVVPAIWAFGAGETASIWIVGALAVVVLAGLLIGHEQEQSLRPTGHVLAMTGVGGLAFGIYYVVMAGSPADSGVVPLVVDVASGSTVALIVVVVSRLRGDAAPRPTRRESTLMVTAGLSQGVGDVLLIFGLHQPDLAVVTALSALYPIGTVALAVVVLRERVRLVQGLGMLLAVGGVCVLAVARG